jgi:type IV pilus assembly protein PilF
MLIRALVLLLILTTFGCAHRQEKDKERADLHLQIGTAHLMQGNYPAALSQLLQAEQLDGHNPAIENNLGLAYGFRGRNKEAEDHFNAALKINSNYSDARSNLARLQIDQKRFDEALKNLALVENDLTYPSPDKALSLTGMAYFEMGKYKKADDYLARAMNAKRDSCITAVYYGRTLYEEKKVEDAAGVLDLAVENCRAAKYEEPLYFSALAYYSLGDKEKSKARLQELISGYPNSRLLKKAKGLMGLLE